jgi:YD repeat-containing protein
MKTKSFSKANHLFTMLSAVFKTLMLVALLVTAGGSSRASSTALHITNTGKNTEALPTYRLDWNASSNSTYLVQSTTNLASGATWTTLDAVTPVDQAGSYQLAVTATDSTGLSSPPATFYRLILPQPMISSVEPAIVAPGAPVDFYILGQSFPPGAVIKINGVTQSGTVYQSSTTLVQPSFTPDVAGSYQFSLVVSGMVVSSFNVTCADALANPEQVLQGPPTEPPASPCKKDFKGHVTLMKAFDDEAGDTSAKKDFKGHVTLMKAFDDDSEAESARTTKTGHVTLMKAFDDGSDDIQESKKGLNAVNVKLARIIGGGDDCDDNDPTFMAALMKAKEKANQCKSMVGVKPFSGEVQECDADMVIPGRGLDFIWARTYRSRANHTATILGNCWSFSYDVRCVQNSSGGMDIFDGTGRKDTFTLQTNGTFICPEFFREGTVSNNTFTLTFADTGRWVFNPFDGTAGAGRLFQIITRNGDTMTLGYDTGGRLAQVVDDLGRTNTVAYNTAGQVASVTDFTGRSVTYQYYSGAKSDNGSAGDLKSVTSPPVTGTPNGNDFPGGKTTTYTYSKSFPLDRENHLLLTVTDPKGQTAAVFTYEHSAADPNYLHCIAAQEGASTACRYNWVLVSRPAGSSAVVKCIANDPVGNVSEYFCDARGRCVIERDYTGRATPGLPVTDTLNRPTGKLRQTDPDFYETQCTWNNDSLCTSETAPGGQQVLCVYQSDFDHSTTARKRADCRVVHELAASAVDLNGDGVTDTSERVCRYDYDPRFGSDPTSSALRESPSKASLGKTALRESPTRQSLDIRESPTLASLRESPTKQSLRESPTKASLGQTALRESPTLPSKGKATLRESPTLASLRESPSKASLGFCTSATDPRGNVTTLSYDANGNSRVLVKHNPFSIQQFSLAYDANGQVTAITNAPDANGRRSVDTFAYSQGQLTQCVVDAGAGGLALTWAFEYDARGNVTRVIDPRTNDCLFTYNALDECVQSQSALLGGGGGAGGSWRVATQYAYDANDNLVQCSTELRDATGNLQGNQVNNYRYDGLDRLSEMALAMDATRAQTNRFVYDGNNQCVQALGPDAVSGADPYQVAAYQYDERGLLFLATNAPGSSLELVMQFGYTPNGLQKSVLWEPHKTPGLDSPEIDYAYDGFDRLASATDPMGNQTVCFYDANDNPKVVRLFGELNDVPGAAGNVRLAESRCEYDGLDRVIRTHDLFFNPATQSSIGSGDAVSTCVYAPNNECVSMTDSLGRTTSFTYDTACRLTSVTDARGNVVVSVRDQLGNATSITRTDLPDGGGSPQVVSSSHAYDALNRCVSSSDNVGNTSTFAYDSLDRVVRVTNPNGNDTTYTYDLLDDCLASTDYAGSSLGSGGLPPTIVRSSSATFDTSSRCLTATDPNGNTTSYAYDSLGNCTTITEADGTHQQLVWSPRSNLMEGTDANGTTVTNVYDLCDRVIHRDLAARGPAVATTTFENFAYNGCSRLVLAGNDVSQLTFSYDSFGDCTGGSQDNLAQSSTFDSEGNLLSLTYPGGRVVTYSYDVLDQVTNISTSANGVSHPQLARFAYAGPGRLARIGRDNGIRTQIDWDGLTNPGNSAGDYGWQEVSRVRDGTVASPSLVGDVTCTYSPAQSKLTRADAGRSSLTLTYDALEQLVESSDSVPARDTVYALDAAGNRSHVITNGVLMTPDYAMSSALPPGDFFMNRYTTTPFGSQQYDANGNLVVRASAAGPIFYHYDYADRLVEVDALSTLGTLSPVATFTYDALGNRISKTTYPGVPAAPVTTQYVNDVVTYKDGEDGTMHTRPGNHKPGKLSILEERVGTAVSRAYCEMTAFTGTGAAQYYHYDDLGNVLALTDAGGNVLERYHYDDYGQPQFLDAIGSPLVGSDGQPVTTSPLGNSYLFHNLEWDGETGLLCDDDSDYFDPQTGRAIRGKVKIIRDVGTGYASAGSGGGGGGGVFAIEPRDILKTYFETGEVPTQDRVSRNILKSYFERGDKPTESQFATLIDSMVNRLDDRNLLGLRVSGMGGNNPWTGGGGGGEMQKGTVKFFNNAKGFGMVVGDGSKTHTKTGHVTLMK